MITRDGSTGMESRRFNNFVFVYNFSQLAGSLQYVESDCITCKTRLFRFFAPSVDGLYWANNQLVNFEPYFRFFKFAIFEDIYIYAGSAMPICEERVRFSNYFWEGNVDPHTMCTKYMHRQGCSSITVDVLESKHHWTEYNTTLICYGIRGDVHRLASGHDPSWVVPHHSLRVVWTIAGEFVYIVHRNKFLWVSSAVLIYGLGIFNGELRGLNFHNDTVSYIPFSMFVLGEADTLERLINLIDFYIVSGAPLGRHQGCVKLSVGFSGEKILADHTATDFYIGKSMKKCVSVYSQNIMTTRIHKSVHLDIIFENDERRWYKQLADDVLDSVTNMLGRLLRSIFEYTGNLLIEMNVGEIVLYMLFYILLFKLTGFVPAAIISLVLFTIIMQWGQLDPG